jgi:hypothetical protein
MPWGGGRVVSVKDGRWIAAPQLSEALLLRRQLLKGGPRRLNDISSTIAASLAFTSIEGGFFGADCRQATADTSSEFLATGRRQTLKAQKNGRRG